MKHYTARENGWTEITHWNMIFTNMLNETNQVAKEYIDSNTICICHCLRIHKNIAEKYIYKGKGGWKKWAPSSGGRNRLWSGRSEKGYFNHDGHVLSLKLDVLSFQIFIILILHIFINLKHCITFLRTPPIHIPAKSKNMSNNNSSTWYSLIPISLC